MSEKHPYEKHLAEKLQHLSTDGTADQNWERMRALLDEEMPRGGAYGSGRNGKNRWWIYGIISLVFLLGTWLLMREDNKEEAIGKTEIQNPASSQSGTENNPGSAAGTNPSDKSVTDPAADNSTGVQSDPSTYDQPPSSAAVAKKEDTRDDGAVTKPGNDVAKENKSSSALKDIAGKDKTKDRSGTSVTTNPSAKGNKDITTVDSKSSQGKNQGLKAGAVAGVTNNSNASSVPTGSGKSGGGKAKGNEVSGNSAGNALVPASHPTGERDYKPSIIRLQSDPAYSQLSGPGSLSPDSIQKDYALLRPVIIPSIVSKKNSRSNKNSSTTSSMSKAAMLPESKMLAFGLTLPLTFPIADQQALSYNFNAGSNKVLDYLPAPHLQYHFNSKTFLQTELQVVAPQYIQSVLLYQSKTERPGATNYRYQVNSIYAQKLYYFNLPVTIQYSPFSHFYLGTGLQFSSMLSGIALYEDKAYASLMPGSPDSLISQTYEKFRNDSVSNKLNGSEFRLMIDANYYWSRFTVGLRYNQALSNYVSIKVNNTTPYFTDKNKSILFYLRYNLWEDRKRKKSNLPLLTFK